MAAAKASTTARTKAAKEARDAADAEDYDAFWGKATRASGARLNNVHGIPAQLPPSPPLAFEVAQRKLQHSQDEADVRHLVGLLFGPDALDHWTDAGMDGEQFAVLLLWGSVNVQPGASCSLAEARDAYLQAEATGQAPDLSAVGKGSRPAPKNGPATTGRKRAPARRGA